VIDLFSFCSCAEPRHPRYAALVIGSWLMMAGLTVKALARTAMATVQLTTSICLP
jgi:hypothetical protein